MNFIKDKITDQITKGIFISSGTAFAAELAAIAGFDWMLLDMEHGLGNESDILDMIRALDGSKSAPIVRIPKLRGEYISRVLDFGAAGIMCPMLSTAEETEQLVKFMRYPPLGNRGLSSGTRASHYGTKFKDYFAKANSELLCVVQIENANALENIDAIAAVAGIDVLFIGHSDLSLNLGCYGCLDDERILEAERVVLEAAHKHGKVAGMFCRNNMEVKNYIKRGFHFLALATDVSCLKTAYSNVIAEI